MDKMNEDELDALAVENFRAYLRFPTVHPNPDYSAAVHWLRQQGESLGLTCFITELIPSNPILIMRWKGREPDLPAILLNSHMDVVPVKEENWAYPPFSGVLSEHGKIYGRGSQDMKCVGIQQLEAVRRLKNRGIAELRRTVFLSFVPDEELGGGRGMQPFVEGKHPLHPGSPNEVQFSKLNIGLCLDEGLASPTDDYAAFYAERTQCWFNVRFKGVAGHGLTLLDGTAGEKLQLFLNRIMTFRAEEKARLDQSNGQLSLGDVTSVNLTMLGGGLQHNVLPTELSASFDVRLPPCMSFNTWKAKLDKWAEEVGGGAEFEFINVGFDSTSLSAEPDEKTDPYWSTLFKICKRFGVGLVKRVFPGGTDARFVRNFHTFPNSPKDTKPIPAIGFSPMRRTPVLLHDHNEYLSRDEFLLGCRVYTELLLELSELP
ncbi:aminoacylase [Clonorchis sinensis]|uniref:N-acyl-aliphatic-L-amino acid amidohydrolase n=1 Tax=Clonorchis sinensis TaxID=79923 RepID=H2KSV7_CLOSI|nr:aminoacylase [Clonorchis sinensis]